MSTDLTPFNQTELEQIEAADQTPVKEVKLNARRTAFIREYVKDNIGYKAAIRAGYSVNSAEAASTALLRVPEIRAAIDKSLEERAIRAKMTADHVLAEMALLAESNVANYVIDDYGNVMPAEGAPDGCMRAVSGIKKSITIHKDGSKTYQVDIKLWDKPTPLKLMGRQVGIFTEKVEVTGKDGAPIESIQRIERIIVPKPKQEE